MFSFFGSAKLTLIKFFWYNLFLRAILAPQLGTVAEWLGKALQKLLQQFESVRYLKQKPQYEAFVILVLSYFQKL